MLVIILLLFIFIILVWNYYAHYGRNGRLINLIPGPSGFPIFGNALQFLGSQEEKWKILTTLNKQYYPIFKVWTFFLPVIIMRHPNDLELLTSGGSKWHSRRKILTPTFHFNILQQFVEILIEESERMTKSLKHTEGTVVKDLTSFVSEHTLNAICETAMGTSLRNLNAFQQPYRDAVYRVGELFSYRAMRPWLYFDWIFSLTPKGREQKKLLKILHGFTENIIAERKLYHERTNGQYLKNFGNEDFAEENDIETTRTRKKRLAMLDHLIAASREGLITDSDIREEVDTFMFGGHDTVATGLCFILALLAEHKDIQVFMIKYKSLFLEKEKSYVVPAGTMLYMFLYGANRDPNFWPNPDVFDPDRFLSEKIRNRHPYSYLPFSAGPRNCIGQRYAMLEMK
ncbi:PREDICTED: cytochrome P450 4C1-like, partial [Wasmannia auropunctata]|uniref:cytochrome P450 4C1-like n=1 Tax=Wasmannia auropunctata TaxID=64793 RepID=UPI0005EF8871